MSSSPVERPPLWQRIDSVKMPICSVTGVEYSRMSVLMFMMCISLVIFQLSIVTNLVICLSYGKEVWNYIDSKR